MIALHIYIKMCKMSYAIIGAISNNNMQLIVKEF